MADSRSTIDRQRAAYRLLAEAIHAGAVDWEKLPPAARDEAIAITSVKRGRPPGKPAADPLP